jgi:hypothetical protein
MAIFSSITFTSLKREIESYLKSEHNKASILYSPASPFGQILSIVENLHQLSILYLKNTIDQFDLGTTNNTNERVIKNTAILAGHNPFRAISATGNLKFTVKGGIDLEKELPSGIISISNKTSIKNNTNSLFYSTNIGRIKLDFNVKTTKSFFIPIIQGKWEAVNFTGGGESLQTYVIQDKGDKEIENFNIEVQVNGETWEIKKHLYDLLPDENSCVVRTGFNSGVDIIFGNGGFGKQPALTSAIVVRYLSTDGSLGNIYRRTLNDWKFIDDVFDANGNTVDVDKIFDIEIYNDINFGADREDYRFTKSLLPIASNNFVLALPQQYAYELKRLGVFTYVNATEKNGTIFIYLVPDISIFKRDDENYFNIPIRNTTAGSITTTSAFELDSYERSKIVSYLKSGGLIQLTKKFIVKSPSLSFYSMNVWVITYSDATNDSVKSQIVNAVSDYFINFSKMDRIPKSEMVVLLSGIRDIHSVKIEFVSKKNEDYHIQGLNSLRGLSQFDASKFFKSPSVSESSYDSNKTIGIDSQLGDIIFEADELPVMRGNWYDRNGNYYSDDNPTNSSNMTSVNVFFKGQVDSKNKNIS